jgi:hypothetical protein
VLEVLHDRQSHIPAENLARWTAWHARIEDALGPDHPYTLATRYNIAYWTGRTGHAHEAVRLYREVLAASERVLGEDDPTTIGARHELSAWTGETGDAHRALELVREVLADSERTFGPDDPRTLAARYNVAGWTGQTGNAHGDVPSSVELRWRPR